MQVKGFGRGGVSKMFQAFVESVTTGAEPTGRYDYARKLMPTHAAIERHRRRLARKCDGAHRDASTSCRKIPPSDLRIDAVGPRVVVADVDPASAVAATMRPTL